MHAICPKERDIFAYGKRDMPYGRGEGEPRARMITPYGV